eukprot:jgi/Chrpa1/27224/Chrysochromulina_OHIO_Genome00025751-RA
MSAMRRLKPRSLRAERLVAARLQWMEHRGILEAAERITTGANLWADLGSRLQASEVIRQAQALGLRVRVVEAPPEWRRATKAHSGAQDWAALRAKYVDAAMADKAGGSMTPAVRHYLRFCVFGRHVSPMRETDVSDPLAMKVADEAFLMDFALWLVLSKPSGRSISVNTAAKYVSTVKAWHLRRFHRRIGADLELASLKDMLKGMRREIGVPPRRVRYGVRTQDLAKAMSTAYAPWAHGVGDDTERLNRLNKKAALSTAFCGLLRAAEMALQPGETWHPELNLSRADVKFHYDEHGAL